MSSLGYADSRSKIKFSNVSRFRWTENRKHTPHLFGAQQSPRSHNTLRRSAKTLNKLYNEATAIAREAATDLQP